MGMWWIIGFAAAGLVVVVVAALLLGILYQARRIRRLALTAVEVVGEIDASTRSIWALRTTNATAAELLEAARSIEANTAAIDEAVTGAHDANRSETAA
jgi:hypothetical protein